MGRIITRRELIDWIYKEYENIDDLQSQKIIKSIKRSLFSIPEEDFLIFMEKCSIHIERLRKNTYYLKYAC